MEKTIKTLRLGSKLRFGGYGVLNDAAPEPIIWLKATPNGDFISENVLDWLCFDALENPNNGHQTRPNADWCLSNIRQYLNSTGIAGEWFIPQHEDDRPPAYGNRTYYQSNHYEGHYGFLNGFNDYELSSIEEQQFLGQPVSVRLLACRDVFGEDRFNIFNKIRGIRTSASIQLCRYKGERDTGADPGKYMSYLLADPDPYGSDGYVSCVNRSGNLDRIWGSFGCGIRPTLRITPNTVVYEVEDGIFAIKPFEVEPIPIVSDDEITSLLGAARP